jgi:hypothetical protein
MLNGANQLVPRRTMVIAGRRVPGGTECPPVSTAGLAMPGPWSMITVALL